MKRIWQIQEQVVEDPSTKVRLEFSSVHTDELNKGNEAPGHDGVIILRMWSSDRNRLATFLFERNGAFIRSEIEPIDGAVPGHDGVDPNDVRDPFPKPLTFQEVASDGDDSADVQRMHAAEAGTASAGLGGGVLGELREEGLVPPAKFT